MKPEGMRDGMSGFRLVVDDGSASLEVSLEGTVDAAAWIAALPTEIAMHRSLVAVSAQDSPCES